MAEENIREVVVDQLHRNTTQTAPMFDWSNVTMDSIVENARSIMPKMLTDWADSLEPASARSTGAAAVASTPAPAKPAEGGLADDEEIAQRLNQLTQDAATFAGAAEIKNASAIRTADGINTALQVRTPNDSTLEDSYLTLVGADQEVVGRMSPGSKVGSKSANIREVIDPATGDVLLTVPRRAPQEATQVQQNDTRIAAQVVSDATLRQVERLDITRELSRIPRLSGEEHKTAMGQLLVSIDLQLAREFQRIRSQAAIEGGYKDAQANLQKNLQLDVESGFAARFNQASAQTIRAQSGLTTSLAAAQHLEQSLIRADTEVAKLVGAKNTLLKLEARGTLREERKQDLRDTVTPQELTNYHFIYGSTGNDVQDRDTIVARRDKEPTLKKVLQADPTNIYGLLTDSNLDVRNKTAKLVNEYDRAANGLSTGQNTTTFNIIKDYIANPLKIIEDAPITKEEKARLKTQLMVATGTERIQLQQTQLANLLQRIVEKRYEQSYGNMSGWRSDSISPGSPLQVVIAEVAKTNPTGAAPLPTVVETFMMKDIKGPEDKPIQHRDKIAMLQTALQGAINNDTKSILMTDFDGIRMRIGAQISQLSMRYEVRKFARDYGLMWR